MAQINNLNTVLPFSKTVSANQFLFVSGQIGMNPTTGNLVVGSFEGEVHQVMKNVESLLKENGLHFGDLVKVTIYLKDMSNYQVTNQVYSSYFTGTYPARVCIAVSELPGKANIEIAAVALNNKRQINTNKEIVKLFLEEVRSGKQPDNALYFMADNVLAHQLNAEEQTTVTRTPQNYSDHIREFLKMYGAFSFKITELIGDDDKVYARWEQTGKHLSEIDGHPATGKSLTEIASCVYRLEKEKIVEYWIQIDRFGFEKQLEQNK